MHHNIEQIAKWAALFKGGRETLEDDHRSGRPITVHTASNIELVKSIIEEESHATFDKIVTELSINRYKVGEIINRSLNYKNWLLDGYQTDWLKSIVLDKNLTITSNNYFENCLKATKTE